MQHILGEVTVFTVGGKRRVPTNSNGTILQRQVRVPPWGSHMLILGAVVDRNHPAAGMQNADVNAPGRNKARGLQILASALGIDLSHAIAFGDSHNDLEMLQAVGTPVAMQGAAADVKDSAIRIAPPNSQDGVLQVLDEVL